MTLTETDRLIRRLREFLNHAADTTAPSSAAAPAQIYADACSGAQRRLEQCAAMLDAGDEQQALQLAEAEPPLLDLLTRLPFAESGTWREFCQANSLPVAPAFDTRLVARLNALYAKGITVQHPLYRDYRAQVMRNRTDEATATLRTIVRLNSDDGNAREELARLENKRLADQLQKLAKAMSANDPRVVVTLVDTIEDQAQSAGLTPAGSVWEAGLNTRREQFRREALSECQALLPSLDSLRTAGKWQAASAMLAHAKALQAEQGFHLDPAEQRRFDDLRSWVVSAKADHDRKQAFDRAVAEVELAVEQSTERQSAARTSTPEVLQAEFTNLRMRWRAVEEFGQPLPEGLEPRYRKQAGLVRLEIDRLQRHRTLRLVAAVAVAVLVSAVAVYFFVQSQRSSEMATQIDHLVAAKQVGAVETLLADARANAPHRFDSAVVQAAAARAHSYITAEHARRQNLEAQLGRLEGLAAETPQPFVSQPLTDTSTLLSEARTSTNNVAPESQGPANARLATIRNRWESFLAKENDTRTSQFSDTMDSLEKRASDELNYHRPPEDLLRSLSALTETAAPLDGLVKNPPAPELKIRSDLAARSDALQVQLASYRREMAQYDTAVLAINHAATLDDYLQALRAAAASEPGRVARELAPAKRLLSFPISTDVLLAGALMPNDPDGWAFFKANPDAGLVPSSVVLDPERRVYDQLLVDSNIRNVYAYQANRGGNKTALLYTRGQLEGGAMMNGWTLHAQGNYYDPLRDETNLYFRTEEVPFWVGGAAAAPNTEAFTDLRFRDLINSDSNQFSVGQTGAPMHEWLDRLVHHAKASGIFKAFVFGRVCQLMQVGQRAGYFGWQYSSALRAQLKRAEQIGLPQSGYWMVPSEIKAKGAAFDSLFAPNSKMSFAQQARLMQAATRDVVAAGISYKGHVDAEGQLRLLDSPPANAATPDLPPPAALWGLEAREGQPTQLFTWSSKDNAYQRVVGAEALPLSPLVGFEANAADVLRADGHRLGIKDETLKGLLADAPPFFKN